MNLNRRGFLGGLISAIAAPAIVRIDSIMPVRQVILTPRFGHSLLTIDQITREAIQIFKNSNAFIQSIDAQYMDAIIGTQLRIKLPIDYKVAA